MYAYIRLREEVPMVCIRGLKSFISIIICISIVLLQPLFVRADVPESADSAVEITEDTVLVGYYDKSKFQEGARKGAVKSGYGYEYLQKIASITGWNYGYVYGTRTELLEKLRKGEIDVLAGIGEQDVMAEDEAGFFLPDYPMVRENYYFYVSNKENLSTQDLHALDGRRIGAPEGEAANLTRAWLNEHGIEAVVVEYSNSLNIEQAFTNKTVTAVVGERLSMSGWTGIVPFHKIGTEDFYLAVAEDREDLLEDLNRSLTYIDASNPAYLSDLTAKYMDENPLNKSFTIPEEEWIASHSTLRVGYFNNYLPFSDTDKDGEVTGIVKDLMPELLSKIGLLGNLKIEYQGYESEKEMLKDLTDGKIDTAFPISNNTWYMEQYGVRCSRPIVSTSMNLVYLGRVNDRTTNSIAVNKNNEILTEYVRNHYPRARIYECNSTIECLDAVRDKNAGCTIVNGMRTSGYLDSSQYRMLSAVALSDSSVRCLGVANDNTPLLMILDRGLGSISDDFAVTASYAYVGEYLDYSLEDFIQAHFLGVLTLAILIAVVLIGMLAIIIYKNRYQRAQDRLMRMDAMTGLFNRRAYEEELKSLEKAIPHNLVYLCADVNGLKTANDTLGHDAGDELIRGAAICIKSIMGKYGKVYRIGGDEYAAILYVTPEEFSALRANVARSIEEWHGNKCETLSISIGYVIASEHPEMNIHEISVLTDQKMYEAKALYYQRTGIDRRKA